MHIEMDLERRFAPIDIKKLNDPDYLSFYGDQPEGVKKWVDLLKSSPTVVLAEGRSGKTYEFRSQAQKLKLEGEYSFFIPLERLHDEEFDEALDINEAVQFEEWKNSHNAEGYFFLDALDELKLRDGTFRKAIKKITKAIEPNFNRVTVMISCRPADWKANIDMQELNALCVPKKSNISIEIENSEENFLNIISRDDNVNQQNLSQESDLVGINRSKVQIYSLLPLSKNEIKYFAIAYSKEHAENLNDHLEKNDLWHLYRLPAEIITILDQIEIGQPLGQLEEQVSIGIQKKLVETEDNKKQHLSLDKALDGAERLALALFLLKYRSIKIDANNNNDALSVNDVLTNWSGEELQELIGKPLFDPSGVGAVRFHHRSSQEYLAAIKLKKLFEASMPLREFLALMFSEIGDKQVIKPGMAPVAAWLALWLPCVRALILEREPSLLFMQGLPSVLSSDLKKQILKAYVHRYSNKKWCRTGIDRENLERVASSDLGDVVRELWIEGYTGYDSRELLLDFIWAGKISDCTDLALDAVLDESIGLTHQNYAAWGVIAAGTNQQKKILADAILSNDLQQQVIRNILPQLVPEPISVNEASSIIDGLDEVANSIHGLSYTIYQISKNDKIDRSDLILLREHLANAIWHSRNDNCKMYSAHSGKDHYQDGLIAACACTIPADLENIDSWAFALAIATHFGERHQSTIAKKEIEEIWASMSLSAYLRESYFWACLKLSDELEGLEEDWPRFIRSIAESRKNIGLNSSDQGWLLKYLSQVKPTENRGIVFEAVKFFFDLKEDSEFTEVVIKAVKDRSDWLEIIDHIINPKPQETDEFELEMQERKIESEKKEDQRVSKWQEWRTKVLSDPDFLMGGDRRLSVLHDTQNVISQSLDDRNSWGCWNSQILEQAFNSAFLERYRKELSIFWRNTDVKLSSERPESERNTTQGDWLLALSGIKAESELPGWANKLTDKEAIHAARIACIELNGFGSFYTELDLVHPAAFKEVISKEVLVQLNQCPDASRADIFSDIFYHGTDNMKLVLAMSVSAKLNEFAVCEAGNNFTNNIKCAIGVIASHTESKCREFALKALIEHFDRDHTCSTSYIVSMIGILDPELGCRELLNRTKNLKNSKQRSAAISAFASIFGDRHGQLGLDLNSIRIDRRVGIVKELVVRAYEVIRIDEDVSREGVYTPGDRDNAQHARAHLFETLVSMKHPAVLLALQEFSKTPEFSHFPDRLEQMSYEIAAQISDATSLSLEAFKAIDRRDAFIPYDNKSLLIAMMSRLDLFEHDILYAEDSPIQALRMVDKETDVRRFIAHWLRQNDRDVFNFTQEAVVVDENRTDIRFHPKSMQGYATVELKRETWSLVDLEKALKVQLVGQYLQHEKCRVGCLLICQREAKKWRQPKGGKMWGLPEVINHLQIIASNIMSEHLDLHIEVKGIDYSG